MDFRLSLSTLDCFFYSIPTSNAPEQVKVLLQPIADFQQVIQRTDRQVTFFGVFNAGKSTLLNAIIGSRVLPTHVNRATGVITKIGYAPQPSANVVRLTSSSYVEEPIRFNHIAKYILLDLSGINSKAPEGIEAVSIGVPLSVVKNRCTLVDTPGLLDNPVLTERTYQEIEKSDLAVMVLSADKLLSQVEKDAAKKVHDQLNGNIVFIVNRLELVDEEEREEILAWARTSLKELGNRLVGQPQVFAVEAKKALAARQNGASQGANTDGLLEFEQWMKKLLNTPTGEKIVIFSRLGILESHLAKALSYLRDQLSVVKADVKGLITKDAASLAAQQSKLKRDVTEDRLKLSSSRSRLDVLGEKFVKDCVKTVEDLMKSDNEWSGKLKNSFDLTLKWYAQSVYQEAESAVCQTSLRVPSFYLSQESKTAEISAAGDPSSAIGAVIGVVATFGMDGGLVSGVIGAAVGSWVGKAFFGIDVKKQTLELVEQTARGLLPILRAEAEKYFDEVDKLLVDFGESNQPKTQSSPSLITAQQNEQYYSNLVHWCNEFQNVINELKRKVAG